MRRPSRVRPSLCCRAGHRSNWRRALVVAEVMAARVVAVVARSPGDTYCCLISSFIFFGPHHTSAGEDRDAREDTEVGRGGGGRRGCVPRWCASDKLKKIPTVVFGRAWACGCEKEARIFERASRDFRAMPQRQPMGGSAGFVRKSSTG